MVYEIVRTLRNGNKLIIKPSGKKILYPHKIIHQNGLTRYGFVDVIEVKKEWTVL